MKFAEINADTFRYLIDYPHPPESDSTHEYRLELDTIAGIWRYYYNGSLYWTTPAMQLFQVRKGEAVHFGGEVSRYENDMPGMPWQHCVFSACELQTNTGIFVPAGFATGSQRYADMRDPTQWLWQVVDDYTFEIWDVHPRP